MKKIVPFLVFSLISIYSFSQDSTYNEPAKSAKRKINLSNRSNDHLMIQLGKAGWGGIPDSIHTKGLSRSFNIYLMMDFPFKTDPRFSVGIGPGIGTDHIYFDKTNVDITGGTSTNLRFQNVADTSHFKKSKLTTAYLEAPIELRFAANPESKKTFKAALGIKVGLLLSASTKSRLLQTSSNSTLANYTLKLKDKKFFNSNRFEATARVGYGIFSLYGSFQLNSLIKEGLGPNVKPYSIGITISGL